MLILHGVPREIYIDIPCLYDPLEACEGCPWLAKNARDLIAVALKLRTREYGPYRLLFHKEGFEPDFALLCDLLHDPLALHESMIEGQALPFLPEHFAFRSLLVEIRRVYLDKYDSPKDPRKIKCPVKRAISIYSTSEV